MGRREQLFARVREEKTEKRQLAGKLNEIKTLADELGSVPTLSKLLAFLKAIRELIKEEIM